MSGYDENAWLWLPNGATFYISSDDAHPEDRLFSLAVAATQNERVRGLSSIESGVSAASSAHAPLRADQCLPIRVSLGMPLNQAHSARLSASPERISIRNWCTFVLLMLQMAIRPLARGRYRSIRAFGNPCRSRTGVQSFVISPRAYGIPRKTDFLTLGTNLPRSEATNGNRGVQTREHYVAFRLHSPEDGVVYGVV